MGPLTRAVQIGIGLAAELKAAKKERKASEASEHERNDGDFAEPREDPPLLVKRPSEDDPDGDENFMGGGGLIDFDDQEIPGSDAAPPPYDPPSYSLENTASPQDMKYPMPNIGAVPPRLTCPVIIPQRRPGSKSRGFMRAYAPVLADYDINEETFLDFLKTFHKRSMASPVLNVITIGAGALGNIPEPFTLVAAISISVLSGTAAELQSRNRSNNYLTEANERFFKPRGLFCLVMSFRPNDVPKGDVSVSSVDTSNAAALKWLDPSKTGIRMKAANFRTSSGVTRGELELPETAPLIYPDTGYAEISQSKNEEKPRGSMSSNRKVAQAYFDKRAQAKYNYKHPESALATESQPQFASKYGDPTHPSVTTSYAGRVSAALKKESLAERQARKRAQAVQPGSARGAIRRVLPSSVLYLMIVNLPTEEELAKAKDAEEQTISPERNERETIEGLTENMKRQDI